YYAISAYAYNPKEGVNPTNTESILQPGNICYNSNLSGANYGDQVPVTHATGSADGTVLVTIMDPAKLTGDKYKVSFHDEMFTLGSEGTWTDITALNKKLGKVTDLTGSNLTGTGIWNEPKDKVVLQYLVYLESIDYDYCNGVILRLPANIIVDSIYNPISNNNGSSIPYIYNKEANTIFFGDSSRNGNGLFTGGEDITLKVDAPALPVITNYTMFDDAFGKSIVDVNGTCTITTIANQSLTQHQWNVTDLASGQIVLKNQTIYNNTDIYAPNYYFANNQIYGPGGSSGSLVANLDAAADPVFSGIKVDVNGNFTVPTTISNVNLNGTNLSFNSSEWLNNSGTYDISDFTIFGYNGTASVSLPNYNGAGGTTDLNALEQDYELKWTGVLGDTVINGDTVVITKSGGSLATLFGARNYSLAAHPLNPNPGSTNPFTIRIPFEVWNTTKNEQVNLLVFDRNYALTNDPTRNGFSVWNTVDRVYTWVVNTKYSTAVINPSSSVVADSATWSWVFFASKFNTGDDIKITYINPIQIGKDSFTFTVPGAVTSVKDVKTIKNFSLSQNYPNPFNPSTRIEYSLPKSEHVTLKVYDILGREVATLVNENKQTGSYSIQFNAGKFASGVYIYRIQAGSFTQTKKLLLLK
ncbi:MAG: T9SS type A sorting domain-containing protein, partial [Ignavibacteriaceae bacterium]|nr:T9SS type A sorting domain-containing protein [Ignavibacteriaceae bacterium]